MTKRDKVLVLGASGLLGSYLCPYLDSLRYNLVRHGYKAHQDVISADLTKWEDTKKLLSKINPDVLINLVALTDVDLCNNLPNDAYLLNVHVVENVTRWIYETNSKSHLIHISTDHVYDCVGLNSEKDIVLKNTYAFSKYSGEMAASTVPATILRTNFFGRSRAASRASFTDWLYMSLLNQTPIKVFNDVEFSPLSLETLVKLISQVIEIRPRGIFNLGSNNGMSKSDFAFSFANAIKLSDKCITATSVENVNFLRTYRPRGMLMNSSNFEVKFNLVLPHLLQEIEMTAIKYNQNY